MSRAWSAIAVAGLLLPATAAAEEPSVQAVTVRIWNRAAGKLVPLESPPNEFGMTMDVAVTVKIRLPDPPGSPLKLVLDVSAPGYHSEATGKVPAWKETLVRQFNEGSDSEEMHFLFVLPWKCYENVKFTATLGKSSKSVKHDLTCAE